MSVILHADMDIPCKFPRKAKARHEHGRPREDTTMNKSFLIGATACAALALAVAISSPSTPRAQGAAPKYEFDSSWPKPFPNRWVNGGLGGL